jgi:hypothetical protein
VEPSQLEDGDARPAPVPAPERGPLRAIVLSLIIWSNTNSVMVLGGRISAAAANTVVRFQGPQGRDATLAYIRVYLTRHFGSTLRNFFYRAKLRLLKFEHRADLKAYSSCVCVTL